MKNVLVVDVGGTSVKILATGQTEPRSFPSGPDLTPAQMVSGVKELAAEWQYDVVSLGYPGLVHQGRIVAEPRNLASGWVGFDFAAAFGRPVKLINDATMQALGSYKEGLLLFLDLGIPDSARRWSQKTLWCPWSWATSLTRREPTRTM